MWGGQARSTERIVNFVIEMIRRGWIYYKEEFQEFQDISLVSLNWIFFPEDIEALHFQLNQSQSITRIITSFFLYSLHKIGRN